MKESSDFVVYPKGVSIKRLLLIVLLGATLVVGIGTIYIYYSYYYYKAPMLTDVHQGSMGTLYVSMATDAPEGLVDQVSMYTYEPGVSNGVFDELLDLGVIPTLQTKIINNAGDLFFVYAPRLPSLWPTPQNTASTTDVAPESASVPTEADIAYQIQGVSTIAMTNYFSGGITPILPADNTLKGERHLNWNAKDKLLAFTAQDAQDMFPAEQVNISSSTTFLTPDTIPWYVYIVDVDTKTLTKVAEGFDPQWLPNGSLVFLGAKGIYQYWPKTRKTELVVSEHDREGIDESVFIAQNMNIDISSDGSLLVISVPNQQALRFYDIVSQTPFRIQISQKVLNRVGSNHQYYWPTFSPDGSMLAVQVTDRDNDGTEIQPRIEFISLDTGDTIESVSLDGYDFSMSFIDDWSY